jgi:hypothetical protein
MDLYKIPWRILEVDKGEREDHINSCCFKSKILHTKDKKWEKLQIKDY